MNAPEISVVVPVLNEEANVQPLARAVRASLDPRSSWELIFVNDGSEDDTGRILDELSRRDERIRHVPLARRYGQSTAMQAGFDHARGDVVITMDGDLQNDPRDIPSLVSKLREGYDLVAGRRQDRKDRLLTRKVPSWVANRIIAWITRVPISDNGCSLKAYRRELLDQIRLYSDMHRFIPALAAGSAGARIAEVPVRHHPRRRGTSKYGLSRIGKVLTDLLIIKMIRSFRLRPLALFAAGAAGAAVPAVGATIAAIVSYFSRDSGADPLVVWPGVALVCFALAGYLLMLGLVGEVTLRKLGRGTSTKAPLVREVSG